MELKKNFKLTCAASGMAALLVVLPAARTIATSAAYFDGVFQGKLAASQHLDRRIPLGRWSASADKEAFAAGYQDGYAQAFAENELPVLLAH